MVVAAAGAIALRPATPADEPHLRRVYASTRADEMAMVPWSAEQKQAFCDMQFDAQDRHYRAQHPRARFDVVTVGDQAAGRLTVDRERDQFDVVDIALLPEFRGRGVATALLSDLQNEARAGGLPVVLRVEVNNRAAELYRRLGFVETRALGIHLEMTWRAES